MEDRPPRAVILELLADVLRDNPPPVSQAKYEFRAYADRVTQAMSRVSLAIALQPKVIPIRAPQRRSSRAIREAARNAWAKRLDETGDEVLALEAAVRATMAREPRWSLRDACIHAIRFVVEG